MLDNLIYILGKYWPWLWQGVLLTLQLLVVAVTVGTAFAIPVAIARSAKSWWLRAVPFAYIYVFRGTPLLVQLYLIYYGFSQVALIRETPWLWSFFRDAYNCALLAFILNTAAYVAEIMRGGIGNVPRGEVEAAIACGMTRFDQYRRIILPRMWRIIWPAYTNDVIFTLKATSLASVVTILELTGMARKIVARTAAPWEAFLTAGAIYLLVVFVLTRGFKLVEARLSRDRATRTT